MVRTFHFEIDELTIQSADLEELLGFEGEIPEPFPALIQRVLAESYKYCQINAGYKIVDSVKIDSQKKQITINNQCVFNPGNIVLTQLKQSKKIAIFTGTAGDLISKHAASVSANGEFLLGYLYDIMGSVVVEKAIDKMQRELGKLLKSENLAISDRFSPGYCDWSVSEQQQLFSLLPPGFCGVSISESSLMHPIKSVSGIIGIGEHVKQLGYQCNWCSDKDCIYGKVKRKKNK